MVCGEGRGVLVDGILTPFTGRLSMNLRSDLITADG